jgi:hypothetical protein
MIKMSSRIIHTLEIHFLIHLSISHGSWIARTNSREYRGLGVNLPKTHNPLAMEQVHSFGIQGLFYIMRSAKRYPASRAVGLKPTVTIRSDRA